MLRPDAPEFSDADLELIHSALRYYAARGGSTSSETRRAARMYRAGYLADRIGELHLCVDEDGSGHGVQRDPLGLLG